ncbi:hypothetical protein OG298_00380 [Streptomyces sp. NBC_01005]|uniref:hypothetical protein n=1 Tax=unclassified Streptomyces TaxID=2593676 RepID=UPI002E33455A|nr:hypothetical protein [Streptomyces sp. NBC_01362]WSW02954.1 hypothetical protein OG298_00380 [Streptomyces sp. NBC_01005]WTB60413.1 hypothetical protein OG832_46015 [Streptomyces sp. NBC_00826]WTC92460.1 hypothetical protein OH736_00375 [Streptomyces sp. NBC_01650]
MPNEATLLLDLDGVSVIRVERLEDGTRRVHLATAEDVLNLEHAVERLADGVVET